MTLSIANREANAQLPSATNPTVTMLRGVICGVLLLIGLATRLASIPLLIDITVAILTTKIPILAILFWPRRRGRNEPLTFVPGGRRDYGAGGNGLVIGRHKGGVDTR